jgi:hypothetical protein
MRTCLALAAVLLLAALLRGGDARAPGARETHLGAGSCAAHACHGGTEDKRNEHTHWRQLDEHARAYLHLLEPLGVQIARRLRLEKPAHEAPECLACHATDPARYALGERFDPRDGVSCEICHGGATHWLGPHAAPGWRDRPPAEKAGLGMRDLSSAPARAALCVDCHVGSAGREVTHDLLAAGHPPLEFDAAAFLAAMPPHWADEGDLEEATWAAGQALIAARRLEAAARAPGDWAHAECGSCHHALDPEGYWAKREPPGRAGRLRADGSYAFVLREILGVAVEVPGFDDAAFARRAAEAAAAARAAAERLVEGGGDRRGALEALLREVASGAREVSPAVARQLAYAVRALSPRRTAPEFAAAYEALGGAVTPGAAYDPAAFARLALDALAAGR